MTVKNLFLEHMASWELDLQARGRSERTIKRYRDTITLFAAYQADHDRELKAGKAKPAHIRDFLRKRQTDTSPGNAAIDFRNLRAFYNWLVREEEIKVGKNPMLKVGAPKVPRRTSRARSGAHHRTAQDLQGELIRSAPRPRDHSHPPRQRSARLRPGRTPLHP
ncbi:hypothetical protein CDO52_00315 [Nocardiopsis gilva YIM 90087]|uniref:Core-binding (CB) domain-containing protein n=1 Tax=Nocardiopsis gilva YIM 90087 TaxID=1235441 RepID=A0A223RZY0_9ACTN|nr:phage integrase N-terminal SAM-like domain-containing protein [Nocardiopsis gilva]ASU81426.1 hypothetical protein CDO52_00315 [Nocardiopsis gilva YIM 90087]